jgi:t-SNARE complex subunit (syntaxin)
VNEAIIQERSEAITQVHRGIVELREVFTDFAKLVNDQQVGIDAISKNVDDAHARMDSGLQQVIQAERHQREGTCIMS